MKSILAIVKRQLLSNKISFIITALITICATTSAQSSIALSNGNYTWLLAIMAPFFIVLFDFSKLIHLGTNKKDYFIGSLISYGVVAIIISIMNTFLHVFIDSLNQNQVVYNLMELCGWTENGIFLAMIQQIIFLFLGMLFLHVLISMQRYWYGWLTDVILIAILCFFIPIAKLRPISIGFFNLIMFNANFLMHLSICIALSIVIGFIGLVILKKKAI